MQDAEVYEILLSIEKIVQVVPCACWCMRLSLARVLSPFLLPLFVPACTLARCKASQHSVCLLGGTQSPSFGAWQNEFINEHIHYMILTSFAIPKNDEMLANREDIVTKWFPIGLEPKILD